MKTNARNIGYEIKAPKEECNDSKCPFHSNVKVRGRTFVGTVIAKDVHHSATVEWERKVRLNKYERYQKRRSRIRVHNPECINAEVGDKVEIRECKPLSKTKAATIVKVFGEDIKYMQKQEVIEEDRQKVDLSRKKKEEEPAKAEKSEEAPKE